MAQDIPPLIYLTPLYNPLGHITPARPSTAARCGDRQASLWGGPCGSLHHGRDRASLSVHVHLETLHMPTLHLERRVKIQRAGHSVEVSRPRTVGRFPRSPPATIRSFQNHDAASSFPCCCKSLATTSLSALFILQSCLSLFRSPIWLSSRPRWVKMATKASIRAKRLFARGTKVGMALAHFLET